MKTIEEAGPGEEAKGVKSQNKAEDTEDGTAGLAVRDSAAFDGGSLPGVQLQISRQRGIAEILFN